MIATRLPSRWCGAGIDCDYSALDNANSTGVGGDRSNAVGGDGRGSEGSEGEEDNGYGLIAVVCVLSLACCHAATLVFTGEIGGG